MATTNTVTVVHAHSSMVRLLGFLVGGGTGLLLSACRPSDVLSVPPPAGVTPSSLYQNQSGAEALLVHGRAQVFQGIAENSVGVVEWSGLLTDEFTWASFDGLGVFANVDARTTTAHGQFLEPGDQSLRALLGGRVTLLSAVRDLEQYEPSSARSKIGEAYALVGYTELLMAEDYCAGVALGALVPGEGPTYGAPLTTDSLLGVAERDFDSAAVYAAGNASIAGLTSIGLARTRLDRGRFAQAAAAVSSVPTAFTYNTELEPGGSPGNGTATFNLYDGQAQYFGCGIVNVADVKGGNGLNFVTAHDPRLIVSTTVGKTCDAKFYGLTDSTWFYPMKFGNPSTYVPLATGIEARLIEAEAALNAGNANGWAADLNALRADTVDTHVGGLPALLSDSTTAATAAEQVGVMFRERAFWLYGTGTRLGDLRRLIRQYGRDQSIVFPIGPYPGANNPYLPSPIPTYGTDVSLTLPTAASGLSDPNTAYKGCLASTKVA